MSQLPTMYRGCMEPLPQEGRIEKIREDRRPRNATLLMTMLFNLMIERQFGVPTVRRRSLFVCGDISNAAQYSKAPDDEHYLGVVEPLGLFRYLYSPLIDDSWGLEDDLNGIFESAFKIRDAKDAIRVLSYFDQPEATTLADLEEPRRRFLANFSPDPRYIPTDPFHLLFADFDRLFKHYDYRMDQSLDEAVMRGAEIMIFDCPEGCRIRPVDPAALKAVTRREGVKNKTLPAFRKRVNDLPTRLLFNGSSVALDIDETLASHPERVNLLSRLTHAMKGIHAEVIVISRGTLLLNSEVRKRLNEAGICFDKLQMLGGKGAGKKGKAENLTASCDLSSRVVNQLSAQNVGIVVSDDPSVIRTYRKNGSHGTFISSDHTSDLMRLTQLANNEYSMRKEILLVRIRELQSSGDLRSAESLVRIIGEYKLRGDWPEDLLDKICALDSGRD